MSLFTQRIDRATNRAMNRFGRTSFKWKADGPTFSGTLGEQNNETKDRKKTRRNVIEVRKVEMPDEPVVGRELFIVPSGEKWEVESYDHDEVTWTIRLMQPKQP